MSDRRWPSDKPPLICMTGIDGCGKSTQVRMLAERLREEGYTVATAWSGGRPYISRPLQRIARRRLPRPEPPGDQQPSLVASGNGDTDNYTRYVAAIRKNLRSSWLLRRGWTDLSLLEHGFEARFAVGSHLRAGRGVVCDRYVYKSIVNLAVLLELPAAELRGLLRHPALRIAPRPTVYFLLDLPPETAYGRKTDLPSFEYIRRRAPIYRALAEMTNMPVVDATQSVEAVAFDIWRITQERLAIGSSRDVRYAASV